VTGGSSSRRRFAVASSLAAALVLASCGYRPVAEPRAGEGSEKLAVVAGVRDELAKLGALASGGSYPRCEVEVLRADEASEGITAADDGTGGLVPRSRATRVGVVARAWIVRSRGAAAERDTGDLRAMETVAVADDARGAAFRHSDALKAAARRAGRRLGSRILGLPAASDE